MYSNTSRRSSQSFPPSRPAHISLKTFDLPEGSDGPHPTAEKPILPISFSFSETFLFESVVRNVVDRAAEQLRTVDSLCRRHRFYPPFEVRPIAHRSIHLFTYVKPDPD